MQFSVTIYSEYDLMMSTFTYLEEVLVKCNKYFPVDKLY